MVNSRLRGWLFRRAQLLSRFHPDGKLHSTITKGGLVIVCVARAKSTIPDVVHR